MARPTKLTPEVEERVVSAISVGASYKDACAYAGISYQTFLNWKKRGQRCSEQADDPEQEVDESDHQFIEFLDRIKRAEGEAVMGWLATVNKAANDDWKAAAWALERRNPEGYGRPRSKSFGRCEAMLSLKTNNPLPSEEDRFSDIAKILVELGF